MTSPTNSLIGKFSVPCQIAFWVAVLLGVLASPSAWAQVAPPGAKPEKALPVEPAEPDEPRVEPKFDAPLPVADAQKREATDIARMLRAGKFDNQQAQQKFDKFYNEYFLARWTTPRYFTSLPRYRQDLRNHFRLGKSGQVFNHLNSLVLDFMGKLVAANRPPVVRVNAMLAIGDLNRVEPSGSESPVPLPEALAVLTSAAENAKLPDGLRAAAMIGVLRHAAGGNQDNDARKSLITAMLRLAVSEPVPGSSAAGHGWIVAQAMEALGAIGQVGDNNAVFNAAVQAVADAKLPLFARIAAAGALGRLNYASATGINPVEASVALEQLTVECCVEALRLAKTADDKSVERRRIMPCLDAVLTAIGGEGAGRKGIASLAKEPDKQAFLAELQKIVKDAIDLLDDSRKEEDDMKPAVENLQKSLEAWLLKKPK